MHHRRTVAGIAVGVCLFLFSIPNLRAEEGPVIINEIHYDPDVDTELVEFVELHNVTTNAIDLSGWAFTSGIDYLFPPGSSILGNGFVVVAQDIADFQTKFGFTPFGPFVGRLRNEGDNLTLRDAVNDAIDSVDYQLGFPWPTVGGAEDFSLGVGLSIELVNPEFDNDLGGNWQASSVDDFTSPAGTVLVPEAATGWTYFKGLTEPPTPAWRQTVFDDSAWLAGQAPVYYDREGGGDYLPTGLFPGNTDLTAADMEGNYSSVYLRKTFVVSNPAQYGSLLLDLESDDGAIVWLNGVEIERLGVNSGNQPHTATAQNSTGEPKNSETSVAAGLLVAGTNVLAVHAFNHQLSGSSDFYIDTFLEVFEGASSGVGPSPGVQNVVFATNVAPQLRQAEHSPDVPTTGEPVRITIKATDPDGVSSLVMEYQVVSPGGYIELSDSAYTNNWTAVAMYDDGVGADGTAGDDGYSAEIPGGVQVHRTLVRYRITAIDGLGKMGTAPLPDDPQPNFAYYVYDGVPSWTGSIRPGVEPVITVPAQEMERLPTVQLISKQSEVENCTWFDRDAGSDYLYDGTLFYDGEVYDHVKFRARGGVWRYAMCKNMWKFRFLRGHEFQARDNWGNKLSTKWTRLNLGASIQQGGFDHRGEQGMFESVGFRLFDLAGVESPHSTFCTFRVVDEADEAEPGDQFEGDFWGVYLILEQMDGRFLDEHGLPDGNLYKMENGTGVAGANGELKNQGPIQVGDSSDVISFRSTIDDAGLTENWWRTNLDVPQYISYYMMVQAIHHYDICCGKNYYFYFNPTNSLMEILPWDLDLAWADDMYLAGDGGTDEIWDDGHPLEGGYPSINMEAKNRARELVDLLANEEQGWQLIEEYAGVLDGASGGPTVLDADRGQWDYNPKMISDTYSTNPSSQAGHGRFYQFVGEPNNGTFRAGVENMKAYLSYRARGSSYPSGISLNSWETDSQIPSTPIVTYMGPGGFPINDLDFRVSNFSGVSSFSALQWRIGEVTPTNGPAFNLNESNKYEIDALWMSPEITDINSRDIQIPADTVRAGSVYRMRCRYRDSTGRWSHWSDPIEFTSSEPQDAILMMTHLRLTELMFNAPSGSEFDYVEIQNTSPDTVINIDGAKFTQGIDYVFTNSTTLAAGEFLVVTRNPNPALFRSSYGIGAGVQVVGPYEGNFSDKGETVTLRTSAGGTDIVTFKYSDGRGWPIAADGSGHSMIPKVIGNQVAGALNYGGNWRASTFMNGSPGLADPASDSTSDICINEVAAHTDFPLPPPEDSDDWIELYNRGVSSYTFPGGWHLSDSRDPLNLAKWEIPPGTMIPAGGVISFDEQTGFHNPTNIGFGLNKAGEEVVLSYLPGTAQDRVVDAVSFKGQEPDWALGRYPDGGPLWYALSPQARNAPNTAPGSGVVISELMYHPPDPAGGVDNDLDEYVEIFNPTASSVSLFDTNGPWRLDGGVDMALPGSITLAPMEYLLAVNFDPSDTVQSNAFRSTFGITSPTIRIVGPYGGELANSSEDVRLEKPQAPDLQGDPVNWVIVDEVIYADQTPWSAGADGFGPSLQRLDPQQSGNDPANWQAASPTPGGPYGGGTPPTVTAQPAPVSQVAGAGSTVIYSVGSVGTMPLDFQWLFNGGTITGATASTLTLPLVTPTNSGLYSVVVMNSAGSAVSIDVTLSVSIPPEILSDPVPLVVGQGDSASFNVVATGMGTLSYQWQKDGANISGATNSFLDLTNVQAEDDGNYVAVVMDANGLAFSQPARLTVLVPPLFLVHPLSQTVVQGSDVTLSVLTSGTLPMSYRWRQGSTTLTNMVNSDSHSAFYTLKNVGPPDNGFSKRITVVATNIAHVVPEELSDYAVLTLLDDTDGDGMPDDWETMYGLDKNNPGDADGDVDGDTMTNREEFQSGTVPTDSNSFLKVDSIAPGAEGSGECFLTFMAVTNRTYTVQFMESLSSNQWNNVTDVPASPSNRVVEVIDVPPPGDSQRIYRLVTPRQ